MLDLSNGLAPAKGIAADGLVEVRFAFGLFLQ